MIRNRLAVLLAERGLKITRVAKDTGISRNTITTTAQNDSEMIRLETINTLCKYLGVTPCEFFEYEPVDFDFSSYVNTLKFSFIPSDFCIHIKEIKMDLFMDIKTELKTTSIDLSCSLIDPCKFYLSPFGNDHIKMMIEFEIDKDKDAFVNETYNKISASFQQDIYKKLFDALIIELKFKFIQKFDEQVTDFSNQQNFDTALSEDFNIELYSDVFKKF